MSKPNKYTFTVLRYVHDIVTGEFLNVGVVLHSQSARVLTAKVRHTYGRLTKVFPTVNGDHFKRTLAHIEKTICEFGAQTDDLFADFNGDALKFARLVLPHDDSSFQWSPAGSGVAHDLDRELDQIYARMVTAHEDKQPAKTRTEDDVWRTFSKSLTERQILPHLKTKEIRSENDSVTFEHAWKNGVWNCLVPVSFDLIDPSSIHDKALRWVGQATALRKGSSEQFKLVMLIGQPNNANVNDHYVRALKVLESMPGEKEFFFESQAEALSDQIAKDIHEHAELENARATA
jgi:hypothetical protein